MNIVLNARNNRLSGSLPANFGLLPFVVRALPFHHQTSESCRSSSAYCSGESHCVLVSALSAHAPLLRPEDLRLQSESVFHSQRLLPLWGSCLLASQLTRLRFICLIVQNLAEQLGICRFWTSGGICSQVRTQRLLAFPHNKDSP